MIRVAQVVGKMNGGGVESVVMNYYRAICRENIQFDFIIDSDSRLVPFEEIEALGGRVFLVPPYQKQFSYQRQIRMLFKEERWRIVHSHVNTLSVFPLSAAKSARVPVRIAHSHSSSGGGRGESARDVLKSLLRKTSNLYPTHRIACSKVAGDWLFGENENYMIIRNAVDIGAFKSSLSERMEARRALGLSKTAFVVGHIGRMAPQKNHRRLLEIFAALKCVEKDSILLLAGDGPLEFEVKEQVKRLGLADSVRFLGYIDNSTCLYNAMDVFCLPSLYEGLPVVGVECQASDTPILASTEVTPEAAMTSLMDFESLSASDSDWAQHLLSMRERALTPDDENSLAQFDIALNAIKLAKVYESCLEGLDG